VELTTQIGESVIDGLAYLGALTSLGARAAYFTFVAPFRGKPLRLQRAVSQAMQTGVGALPILSLITFFIGLILALQSAYELRKFGALNFVASAVAISMTRELGPLITAIVVIGRSGSAFAAEIGTMKVTEEIDALETMAIDPIHFLVTPNHLGELHGNTWRLAFRRGEGGFYVWDLHPLVAGRALSARHRDGFDQERHVRYYHYRRGLPRRTFHGRRRGAGRTLHHKSRGRFHFSGNFGGLGFYHALFLSE